MNAVAQHNSLWGYNIVVLDMPVKVNDPHMVHRVERTPVFSPVLSDEVRTVVAIEWLIKYWAN